VTVRYVVALAWVAIYGVGVCAVIQRERRQAALEASLRHCIMQIVIAANSALNHAPLIDEDLPMPVIFPFKVRRVYGVFTEGVRSFYGGCVSLLVT